MQKKLSILGKNITGKRKIWKRVPDNWWGVCVGETSVWSDAKIAVEVVCQLLPVFEFDIGDAQTKRLTTNKIFLKA